MQGLFATCSWRRLAADLSGWSQLQTLSISMGGELTSFEPAALPDSLEELLLRNNALEGVSAALVAALPPSLRVLNLAGNKLALLDAPLLARLPRLTALYLGGNALAAISERAFMAPAPQLQVLYLGGNRLAALPESLGRLGALAALYMHDNALASLPASLPGLAALETLTLHRNAFAALPAELLALRRLRSLSVRENPLVTSFAEMLPLAALPSLTELAARAVVRAQASDPRAADRLPAVLADYLGRAQCCHACASAYFAPRASRIEFVDLCGSMHVPFLQFVCGESCPGVREGRQLDPVTRAARVRKVLLDRYNPALSAPLDDLRSELQRSNHWEESFD